MEDRINNLESLFAQQDSTIAQLNREVFRQQNDIVTLRRQVELLKKKIAKFEPPEEIAGSERPPHW
jgi:uncharacterized coiled-coil protein SlyX